MKDHDCGNFKKQINKLGKKHKELKNFGIRCAKSMKRIMKQSKGDSAKFLELVDKRIDHFCGFHDNCDPPKTCTVEKLQSVEAKVDLMVHTIYKTINFIYRMLGICLPTHTASTKWRKQRMQLKVCIV